MKGPTTFTYSGSEYEFIACKSCGGAPTVRATSTVQWGVQFAVRCLECQANPIPMTGDSLKTLSSKWNEREA